MSDTLGMQEDEPKETIGAQEAKEGEQRECSFVTYFSRMTAATFLHGVVSGIVGILVAMLIRQVQIVGFGNEAHGFLNIAMEAPEWRRMLSVTFGGVFGAIAWFWLRGCETVVVPVSDSMDKGQRMPVAVTVFNAMIQDITVAFGGSYGREAAPRELCAMCGGILADMFKLPQAERRILIACGTGAGLAAVYSVPVSGVFYTIEHILDWDISLVAVIPATITSCVATAVSSFVVETNGLYSVPNYSYSWPSLELILWAVFIGPVAGLAAALFVRLVGLARTYRPFGRLPIEFQEAPSDGRRVSLLLPIDGVIVRKEVEIIRKTPERGRYYHIHVQRDGASEEEMFDEQAWKDAEPEGDRDWHILTTMPTAFLVLALFSVDFPSLLGNGRALAQVAIFRQRAISTLAMLFILKAFLTAAAIASGVDGGTLTPSVALGATLGAVVGEGWLKVWPSFSPPTDVMALISAAAFLAAAMKAPVTGLWLLIEFSAQGICVQDLLMLFRGDISGLRRSKFACGMLLPMAIAVAGATLTLKYVTAKPTIKPEEPPPLDNVDIINNSQTAQRNSFLNREAGSSKRRLFRSRSMPSDLDLGHEFDDELYLDEETKSISFSCFRNGLRINMILTVAVAAMLPKYHTDVMRASLSGIVLGIIVGVASWAHSVYPITGYRQVDESANSWKRRLQAVAFAAFCAALGATVPAMPWALHVWRKEGAWTALAATAMCAIAATAFVATLDADLPFGDIREEKHGGVRIRAVLWQTAHTALIAAGSCAAGIAALRLCSWLDPSAAG